MSDALFDPAPFRVAHAIPVPEEPGPKLTLGQRQAVKLNSGLHPLSRTGAPIRLHHDAAPADDKHAAGLRCGDCVHRVQFGHVESGRDYWKCDAGWDRERKPANRYAPRISMSSTSDVRSWWPACTSWEAS